MAVMEAIVSFDPYTIFTTNIFFRTDLLLTLAVFTVLEAWVHTDRWVVVRRPAAVEPLKGHP